MLNQTNSTSSVVHGLCVCFYVDVTEGRGRVVSIPVSIQDVLSSNHGPNTGYSEFLVVLLGPSRQMPD